MAGSKAVVVVPAYNEGENLKVLIPELFATAGIILNLTLIVVDDGSNDSSSSIVDSLRGEHPNLILLRLPSRCGKARALSVGLREAISLDPEIVCIMDGDCQDNPIYLPLLAQKALSGFDLVTARRVNRAEKLPKRVSSKIYNRLVRFVFGVPGRDHNSGMKAFSPRLASFLVPFLHGDMHRHISVLAHWRGFSLSELSVMNRERKAGISKYGISRLWFGFEELLMVRFLLWRIDRRLDFIFYILLVGLVGVAAISAATSVFAGPMALFTNFPLLILSLATMTFLVVAISAVGALRSGKFLRLVRAESNSAPGQ